MRGGMCAIFETPTIPPNNPYSNPLYKPPFKEFLDYGSCGSGMEQISSVEYCMYLENQASKLLAYRYPEPLHSAHPKPWYIGDM